MISFNPAEFFSKELVCQDWLQLTKAQLAQIFNWDGWQSEKARNDSFRVQRCVPSNSSKIWFYWNSSKPVSLIIFKCTWIVRWLISLRKAVKMADSYELTQRDIGFIVFAVIFTLVSTQYPPFQNSSYNVLY